jgi:hypothetical protein
MGIATGLVNRRSFTGRKASEGKREEGSGQVTTLIANQKGPPRKAHQNFLSHVFPTNGPDREPLTYRRRQNAGGFSFIE